VGDSLFITVFTPTYNRAHTLPALYNSLKAQEFKDFEWLIVDDGSSDQTRELIKEWLVEENSFKITYIRKGNRGGKHRAINTGTELAKGLLFFIVDSDDYLVPDSLKKIHNWEQTIPIAEKPAFAGISGNRGFSPTQAIGGSFGNGFLDATSLERKKFKIMGDKAEVFYTAVLKKFRFPEFEGEYHVTPAVVWFRLAHSGYKIRWFNEVVYICNYLEDGITKNMVKYVTDNPLGVALFEREYQCFMKEEYEKEFQILKRDFLKACTSLGITEPEGLFEKRPEALLSKAALYEYFILKEGTSRQINLRKLISDCLKNSGEESLAKLVWNQTVMLGKLLVEKEIYKIAKTNGLKRCDQMCLAGISLFQDEFELVEHLFLSNWPSYRYALLRNISGWYQKLGLWLPAKKAIELALEEAPFMRGAYLEKIQIDEQLGLWEEVKKTAEQAQKIFTDDRLFIGEEECIDNEAFTVHLHKSLRALEKIKKIMH